MLRTEDKFLIRSVFFNENLARTEDNEIHYRMREAGFKLCFDPDIISYQHIRSSLPKMLKQKYSNGLWIGKTAKICPQCLSLYHFVPFAFVSAIIMSVIGTGQKICMPLNRLAKKTYKVDVVRLWTSGSSNVSSFGDESRQKEKYDKCGTAIFVFIASCKLRSWHIKRLT